MEQKKPKAKKFNPCPFALSILYKECVQLLARMLNSSTEGLHDLSMKWKFEKPASSRLIII